MLEREQTIPPAFKANKPPRSFADLVTYDIRLRHILNQRVTLLVSIGNAKDLEAVREENEFSDDKRRKLGVGATYVERSIGRLRLAIVATNNRKIIRRERDLLQIEGLERQGIPYTENQRRQSAAQLADLKTLPQRDPVLAEALAYSKRLKEEPGEIKPQPTGIEVISEEEKQRREQLLNAIKSFELSTFERRSLEVGVIYSAANPGSLKDWAQRMYPDEKDVPLDMLVGRLTTIRKKASVKVVSKINLVTVWPEGQGTGKKAAHYLELVPLTEPTLPMPPTEPGRKREGLTERADVIIDGRGIGFTGRLTIRAFQAVAATSGENRIPMTKFVEDLYGQSTPAFIKNARSLVGIINKGQGRKNDLEIVIEGKDEKAEVYLKKLEKPSIIVPDLNGLRYKYKELPSTPLETQEFLNLRNHPEVVDYIKGRAVRQITGELFRGILLNDEALTRIGNAIVMFRNSSSHPAIEDLDVLLEQALFEEVASLDYAQNFIKDNLRLITPTQTFLLIANINPNQPVTEKESTFGLSPRVGGFESYPHGLVAAVTADAIEIRRVLWFEYINGRDTNYEQVRQKIRRFNHPNALTSAFRLEEDPRASDRLGAFLNGVDKNNPDKPLIISPASVFRSEYSVPTNSRFDFTNGHRIELSASTDEIQGFVVALTKAMGVRKP